MAEYDDFDSCSDDDYAEDFIATPAAYSPGMSLTNVSTEQQEKNSYDEESCEVFKEKVKPVQAQVCNPGISIDKKLSDFDRRQHFLRIQEDWRQCNGNPSILNKLNSATYFLYQVKPIIN